MLSSSTGSQSALTLNLPIASPQFLNLFLAVEGADCWLIVEAERMPMHSSIVGRWGAKVQKQVSVKSVQVDVAKGILSVAYGYEYTLTVEQLMQAFRVAAAIPLPPLLPKIASLLSTYISSLDIFPLLNLSLAHPLLNSLTQSCLSLLQEEGYEQLRIDKYDLFNCDQITLRVVIDGWRKGRESQGALWGVGEGCVKEVIQEYCKNNFYSEENKKKLVKELEDTPINEYFTSLRKMPSSTRNKNLSPYRINIHFTPMQAKPQSPTASMIQLPRPTSTSPLPIPLPYSPTARSCSTRRRRKSSPLSTSLYSGDNYENQMARISLQSIKESQGELTQSTRIIGGEVNDMLCRQESRERRCADNWERLKEMEKDAERMVHEIKANRLKLQLLTKTVEKIEKKRSKSSSNDANDDEQLQIDLCQSRWIVVE